MKDLRLTDQTPQSRTVTVLGIETSCDETATAVVRRHADGSGEIVSSCVLSQITDHAPYGGVVPEIAARAHIVHLDGLIDRAMNEANCDFTAIDAIAATAGPGLLGGVMVGLMTAKGLALALGKPLIAVNHLEGHALTPGLTEGLRPPYLLLLVSGGHSQLLAVDDVAAYRRYGTTIDDALGEAFDKTAKLLSLGYPGGPAVELAAASGDDTRYDFPRPLAGKPGCNFSFSGLKTAVRQAAQQLDVVSQQDIADICAGFQKAVAATLRDRVGNAMAQFSTDHKGLAGPTLVIAGGVAANKALRGTLLDLCTDHGWKLSAPPVSLCSDNAAMIAWAGAERFVRGMTDPLDVTARARWPLDPAAEAVPYAGVKA
ncbi:MAG: tRNA (adenosine(37)-N6)-threonylcarbamoyltransferase complex transferase subunit TsaD [Rhizobiales bacterium]|nr:tRNA (adenosine(37)-N6)-threonylcarbamoyltransferase complex transferase subunit TsaD [Hyphomicrobiales bacterium]